LKKAEEFVRRLGVWPRGDGRNEMSLQFPNGSRIVGLPGSERTVRGFSAVDLLLVDEASRVEDDLYKAVRPMLAVKDGDLWLMSTPHGKRGFFHQEWEYGGEVWRRVKAPATECARIRPEFLEEERRVQGGAMVPAGVHVRVHGGGGRGVRGRGYSGGAGYGDRAGGDRAV